MTLIVCFLSFHYVLVYLLNFHYVLVYLLNYEFVDVWFLSQLYLKLGPWFNSILVPPLGAGFNPLAGLALCRPNGGAVLHTCTRKGSSFLAFSPYVHSFRAQC